MDKINFVINPETNRQIKIGGPVWQELIKKGYKLQTIIKEQPSKKQPSKNQPSQEWLEQANKLPTRQRPIKTYHDGRGSKTRGWSVDAPQRGRERHQLKAKCGDSCFLIPENESFPICARCKSNTQCDCEIDCRGLAAAKIRAHQWKYTQLYDTIDKLEKAKCK